MSFRSRSSMDRRPFRGASSRYPSRGRIRSFDGGRGHYGDRGGRYGGNFRGSHSGWFGREHEGNASPNRRSSSRDRYSDSHRYQETHNRDNSFHRGYKEDSSGYRPRGGYNSGGGHSNEHVKYNFKSESTFKRPRDYDDYEEYHSPSSSFSRISRSSSRGGNRGTTFRKVVLNRRPFMRTSVFRSRGFKSGRFGGRVSAASLHKMKIIRMMRMKNAARGMYDRHLSSDEQGLSDFEDNIHFDEEQGEQSDDIKNEQMDDSGAERESSKKRSAANSPKKSIKKKIKKDGDDKNKEENIGNEEGTAETGNSNDVKSDMFIPLECPHCKITHKTFMNYTYHLHSLTHKRSMTRVFQRLKNKIITLRGEQREKQLELDAQDESTRRWYCDLCKLQYKQPKITHYTSDYHKYIAQFLQPRCRICHIEFQKPIAYEHHRSSLSHVKRKAYLKRQREVKENVEVSGEQFITLDSVGSGDDEAADSQQTENVESEHKETAKISGDKESTNKTEDKKSAGIDSVSSKYMKRVNVYYCKLCSVCLSYKPTKSQDLILRLHCRGRSHIRQLMRLRNEQIAKRKAASKSTSSSTKADTNKDDEVKQEVEENWDTISQVDDKDYADTSGDEKIHNKSSEDEDDIKSENRFDKFSNTTTGTIATTAVAATGTIKEEKQTVTHKSETSKGKRDKKE